jgi:hypothetical protein
MSINRLAIDDEEVGSGERQKTASDNGGVDWGVLWRWYSMVSAMDDDNEAAGGEGVKRKAECNNQFELKWSLCRGASETVDR